jgi:hypothetical protein
MLADTGALNQLAQHPGAGPWMDERDPPAVQPDPWRLIYQLDASLGQRSERPGQIVNQIGDVVESLPA